MNLLIEWLAQPLSLLSFLVTALLILCLRAVRGRLTVFIAISTALLFWIFTAPAFTNPLVSSIENLRSNPQGCDKLANSTAIVVLGAGMDNFKRSREPYELLDHASLVRLHHAVNIANAESHFFLLGGRGGVVPMAQLMKAVLLSNQIDINRISTDSSSSTTVDNAKALKNMTRQRTILLVSSALHTYRAAKTFEKLGFTVCHSATDSQYSKPALPASLLPYMQGLNKSSKAVREILAIALYRYRGYI